MRSRSVVAIVVCASALFASPAIAARAAGYGYPVRGTYLSAGMGMGFISDADLEEDVTTGQAQFDTGFTVQGAVGHSYPSGIRAEIEVSYRTNEFDEIRVGSRVFEASGDIRSLGVLLNGYYDFRLNAAFTPYVGAGVGFANVTIDTVHAGPIDLGSHDDTVFAYQLTAGIEVPILPTASIDLSYRFFGTSNPKFGPTEAEYQSHNLTAGVRLYF